MPQFEIGNKAAEKWTYEKSCEKMEEIYNYAVSNDCVDSLYKAFIDCGITYTIFDYIIEKYPVLGHYKKDINSIVIMRLNTRALNNDCNVTAAIWRFKQSGEREKEDHQKENNTIQIIVPKENAEKLKNLFGNDNTDQ